MFVWPGLTGYMGDCWRALAKRVELKVVADARHAMSGGKYNAAEVLQGLDWSEELPSEWHPDAVFTVGWSNPLCVEAARRDWGPGVKRICCFDMPWRPGLRCFAARFALRRHVRLFDAAYVAGVSAAKYARWLGFPKVETGLFSIDVKRFERFDGFDRFKRSGSSSNVSNLSNLSNPSNFLFVGRKVREKGIETLKKAYEIYRQGGGQWTLTMPEWIDPKDVPGMMRAHACLVLPSLWEPWGVVVAEAKAAGMKVIVSDKVGARLDIPCDEVVRAGDAKGLAAAMRRMERCDRFEKFDRLDRLEKFGCEAWTERVLKIVEGLK